MGFYTKFSEKDLLEAYKNQIDYQGEANDEILSEIKSRSNLDDFLIKVKNKQSILEERNRIIREIHGHYMNFRSKEECSQLIHSNLISQEEKLLLIKNKYSQISFHVEDLKVDRKTIIKSFTGTIVSSIITFCLLILFIKQVNFILISFLIPIYIVNYFIIKLITGKSRRNLAVFLASFFATVLCILYFFICFKIFHD